MTDDVTSVLTGHTNCHLGDDAADALGSECSQQEEGPVGSRFIRCYDGGGEGKLGHFLSYYR